MTLHERIYRICDLCNKEWTYYKNYTLLRIDIYVNNKLHCKQTNYDLCDDCTEKIRQYLEEEKS